MTASKRDTPLIAVVTGTSRGLGKALASHLSAEKYLIVSGQRTCLPSPEAKPLDSNIKHLRLDLAEERSQRIFSQYIVDHLPYIDVLVNNAAICPVPNDSHSALDWHSVLEVNFCAPVRLTERLLPLLQRSPTYPRVINISSGDGELLFFSESLRNRLQQLDACPSVHCLMKDVKCIANDTLCSALKTRIDGLIYNGQPAYKLSKAALNGYTRFASRRRTPSRGSDVAFVSVCPGDVDTDMADADVLTVSPHEAVRRLASVLEVTKPCKNGVFLRHGAEISW